MFELLQHNSGYYGHYRSRIRNDFMNEYRQRAKPQPPQKYLDRSKVSLHHHVMIIARSLLLLYCRVTDIMVVSQWELSDNWELLSPVTTLIEFVGCWRKGRRSFSSTPPFPNLHAALAKTIVGVIAEWLALFYNGTVLQYL